jgi:nucleotide-binding universal stress UspA family protein
MNLPKNILVPVDFSEGSEHALDYAVSLASKLDAKIHLLHVITIPALGVPEIGAPMTAAVMDGLISDCQKGLENLAQPRRKLAPIGEVQLRTGDARDMILNVADETSADLIVMGTHGRRGVKRVLLGSVAETVVRTARCPVLTIRAPKA